MVNYINKRQILNNIKKKVVHKVEMKWRQLGDGDEWSVSRAGARVAE